VSGVVVTAIGTAYRRVVVTPCKTHTLCMGRYLPIIIEALLTIFCVVEVAQAPPFAVRRMPRWLWATAIICLPLAGPVSWLFLGRPTAESLGKRKKISRPSAPDDDVDFLRGL
jgi:Phospholipase_D-nuclease N-terminal